MMRRRAVLAGAGAAVGLPAAAAPTNPDAALIALCDEFIAADRRWCDLQGQIDGMPKGPARDAIEAEINGLSANFGRRDVIADMEAKTLAGLVAKAKVELQFWNDTPPRDADVAYSLMRDMLAVVSS